MKEQDISSLEEKLLNIQDSMNEILANNKFATFLKRIFRRKKVVAVVAGTDDSSSRIRRGE